MNITIEVRNLVVYVARQREAKTRGNTPAVLYHGKLVRQSLDKIGRWIYMAEAAVRFADAAAQCPGWEAVDEGHGKELMELVGAYEAAREAVRKLEGQADGP